MSCHIVLEYAKTFIHPSDLGGQRHRESRINRVKDLKSKICIHVSLLKPVCHQYIERAEIGLVRTSRGVACFFESSSESF